MHIAPLYTISGNLNIRSLNWKMKIISKFSVVYFKRYGNHGHIFIKAKIMVKLSKAVFST